MCSGEDFLLRSYIGQSKYKGNDQELIQSNPTPRPKNREEKEGHTQKTDKRP